VTPEIQFRNYRRRAIRISRASRFLVYNRRSLRQRQTRRKVGTQSHGPTVLSGIRQPGRRRHLSGSEIVTLVQRGRGASLVRPHLDGEIAVASITFDARGLQVSGTPLACPDRPLGAVTTHIRPSCHALTGAVGRSHTTPTPDPDPRDSGRRTSGALRLSELAPRLTRAVPPGRAQGLHPAPQTHQSNGVRSSLTNNPRLGPAHPYNIGPRGRVLK
jgi:hypothetical protein